MIAKLFKWLGLFAAALIILFLAYQGMIFAKLLWWRENPPEMTAFMQARLDVMRETKPDAKLKHVWVPQTKISNNLKRAILTAEDDKFLDHDGFDWEGIQKAIEKNEKRGKVVAGGSTISQQLAKNLFLSGTRSFVRKGQEAIITVMMETALDKDRILEIYLNVIEWGDGVFGAEAAARYYFGVTAANLSAYQAAKLAAMVPRPRFYDRNRNAPYLLKRTDIILGRMHQAQIPQEVKK
jgi:monofunctional glycosyltransferase